MSSIFSGEHFFKKQGSLEFRPVFNPFDYDLMEWIMEAERNLGALARLGLKNHPLKPTIRRDSIVKTAHFTTKMEHNKLDYEEVEQLYKDYKTNKISTLQKHGLEVKNVFEAYDYLYRLNPTHHFSDMNEHVLKNLHYLLMKDLSEQPKDYRTTPVSLKDGCEEMGFAPPAFGEVPKLMAAFFKWLYSCKTGHANYDDPKIDHQLKIHPLLLSGLTHLVLSYVHPFSEGNGKTARAFSTLVALTHPDLSTIKEAICVDDCFDERIEDYYASLGVATQGNLKPFLMFHLECLNASLMKVLRELQRYDKITHVKEVLGRGHARTMFEIITHMEDGETFHRQLFDEMLSASRSSIARNLSKLKDLQVIKSGATRGEYVVSIV